ncbi:MAG: A/G-specific adenine glycosylase [Phycisphaerales bacterium]|nr:A/G-specific adenine glycosylase [Phycisphaerales bacterium]
MNDRRLAAALLAWFASAARDLPWRRGEPGRRDPYHALVSELMLQQTQAARVTGRFKTFLARFPTVLALADADESDVLAAWSGLGYYRRARHLHAAARTIVESHGGAVPRDAGILRSLPGVGRYTAGAIASIAFDLPEPIVDGNVARVLLRLHGRDEPPTDRSTERWCWRRAHELVGVSGRPGAFNEAMMELGATVCAPRAPACPRCPLAGACEANRQGRQDEIPAPKPRVRQKPLYIGSVLAIDPRGRRLVERRPESGLWAGLWQPPSLQRDDRFPTPEEMIDTLHLAIIERDPIDRFAHQTTHRDVRFEVWRAESPRAGNGRIWRSPRRISALALGTPQKRVLLETGG